MQSQNMTNMTGGSMAHSRLKHGSLQGAVFANMLINLLTDFACYSGVNVSADMVLAA